MELIKSQKEYSDAIREIFNQRRRFCTNNLLSDNAAAERIDNRRLYLEKGEFGLWILCDEIEYYIAYLYLFKEASLQLPCGIDKPVITELIGNSKKYVTEIEDTIKQLGFTFHAKNLELLGDITKAEKIKKDAEKGKAFFTKRGLTFKTLRAITPYEYGLIWKLWIDTIDRYAIRSFTKKEYMQMTLGGRGVYVVNAVGEVVGAEVYEKVGNTVFAHHVAVKDGYRGLGAVIMNECMSRALDEGTEKYICWIADDNTDSIAIHKAIGTFTDKYSNQFILQKESNTL